jgi:hypothetical protein
MGAIDHVCLVHESEAIQSRGVKTLAGVHSFTIGGAGVKLAA